MPIISNIRVGKPDTSPSTPSHTKGVKEGNAPGSINREAGIYHDGTMTKGTARRSTGIAAENRNPIDPHMPNLMPP
jgi:hypothetical protein